MKPHIKPLVRIVDDEPAFSSKSSTKTKKNRSLSRSQVFKRTIRALGLDGDIYEMRRPGSDIQDLIDSGQVTVTIT